MRKFLAKHAAATTGTVSGFDRVLLESHLPLGSRTPRSSSNARAYPASSSRASCSSKRNDCGRTPTPWLEPSGPAPVVPRILRAQGRAGPGSRHADDITGGLVCVVATVEPCHSFRLAYGRGRPAIRPAWRKCLFLYFYFLEELLAESPWETVSRR